MQIHLDRDQLLHPAPRKASEHDRMASRRKKSPLVTHVKCGRWTLRKQTSRTEYPSPVVQPGKLLGVPVSPIGAGLHRWHFPAGTGSPVTPWASRWRWILNPKKGIYKLMLLLLLLLSYFLAVYFSTSRLWNVTLNNIISHTLLQISLQLLRLHHNFTQHRDTKLNTKQPALDVFFL